MSLASKKAKEGKNRKNFLPKLKTILANPVKTKCPTLDADELQQLRNLLQAAIQTSNVQNTRMFATAKHIRLGLESSLRAINNCQATCIFLSLNIQPKFLVGLVARNAEVKNETTPVYAQPNLEQFTEEVFGVRSLALVLPTELREISEDLEKWVSARTKPKKVKNLVKTHTILKKKVKSKTIQEPLQAQTEEKIVPQQESAQAKSWSGDFISFSNAGSSMEMDKLKLEEDKDHLLGALSKMATNIKEKQQIHQSDAEEMDTTDGIDTTHPSNACEPGSDSDDFLQEYQPLTVHKIRPNPDKKPKKKRKKNKNKKTK